MPKKNIKNLPKRNKTRRRGRKTSRMVYGLTPYQSLLVDPCNAAYDSPYGGERGMVQRFSADFTLNTLAGLTSGYLAYTPGTNLYVTGGNASPSVAITPQGFVGPGATFLAASSAKYRPVAACVTIVPAAVSLTNMTGELGCAITAGSQISTTGSYTTDQVFTLTQARGVLAKRVYEVNWYPGIFDGTYATTIPATGSAAVTDLADSNAILIAWRGYPAGSALSFRVTVIYEWTPTATVGTTLSSTPGIPVDVHKEAAVLHRARPDFWHNLGNEIKKDAGIAARYVARHAMSAAGSLATGVISRGAQYLGGTMAPALLAM
nr:MAG: hypothetical protein [Chemarfal virus 275]